MKNSKLNVAVYVDLQNVFSIKKQADLLLNFCKSQGDLIRQNVYYNSQSKNQTDIQKKLESLGFSGVDVPCPVKDSADNKLKSDLMDDIYSDRSPDIIILVSGDGDFANPIRFAKERGKKAIVIAQFGNIKQELKNLADEFHFIENLPELIGNKNQPETTNLPSQILWEQAVNYLIQSLKVAAGEGKPTTLSSLGQLIRKSAGVPKNEKLVICKKNGSKFAKFSIFIDAAVKDGKVVKKGDRLLLPSK